MCVSVWCVCSQPLYFYGQWRLNDKQQSRKKIVWQNYDQNRLGIIYFNHFLQLLLVFNIKEALKNVASLSLASSIMDSQFMAYTIRWKTTMVYSHELSIHRCMCAYVLKNWLVSKLHGEDLVQIPCFLQRKMWNLQNHIRKIELPQGQESNWESFGRTYKKEIVKE